MTGPLALSVVAARRHWDRVEQEAATRHDPELIEHATIAALAIRHVADRIAELDDDARDLLEAALV